MGDDEDRLELADTDTTKIRVVPQSAVIDTRVDFAGQHLFAAAKFSRLAGAFREEQLRRFQQ